MKIYTTNDENLKITEYDTEVDILNKIYASFRTEDSGNHKLEIIPITGISFEKKNGEIYYTVITDVIDKRRLLSNFGEYTYENSKEVIRSFLELKKQYKDVTKEQVRIISLYILSTITPFVENRDIINDFIIKNNEKRKQIIQSILNKNKVLFTQKEYMNFDGNIQDYSIIVISISSSITNKPIDIYNLIRKYKMSKTVPLMFTIKEYSTERIVKFYKKFNKEQIKKWIFSGETKLKKPKGLVTRVFFDIDNEYKSAIISRITPNIHLKLGFSESNQNIKYKDYPIILKNIETFLTSMKMYLQKRDIIPIKHTITKFSIKINLLKKINIKKLSIFLRGKYNNFNFTLNKINLKIEPLKFEFNYIIKSERNVVSSVSDGTSILSIYNLRNENDIQEAFNLFFTLIRELDLENRIITLKEPQKKVMKHSKKLKELKQLGININPVECQKRRQIEILKDNNIPKDSYILEKNSTKLYCPHTKHKFPGFTKSNTPCCFLKDQREKDIYIKNVENNLQEKNVSDSQILKLHIITKDKILLQNRLGTIPSIIKSLLDENYFKFGVLQNDQGFINSINSLLNREITKEILNYNTTKNIYNTLCFDFNCKNGISKYMNYEKYIKTLDSNMYDHRFSRDLIQLITGVGIIIININGIDQTKFSIEMKNDWELKEYKEYILILKEKEFYEPIIHLKSKEKKIQRIFKNNDPIITKLHTIIKKSFIEKSTFEPPNIKFLLRKGIKIDSQLINVYNKVEYITIDGLIVPVKLEIPYPKIKQVKKINTLFTALQTYNRLKKFKIKQWEPVSQFVRNGKVVGIMTYSGIHIPTIKSEIINGLEKIENYIPFYISNILFKGTNGTEGTKEQNKIDMYIIKVRYYRELYERVRFTLSRYLNDNITIKDQVKKIISDIKMSLKNKNEILFDIVKRILDSFVLLTNKENIVDTIPSIRSLCHEITESFDPFCKKDKSSKNLLAIEKNKYQDIITKIVTEMLNTFDIINGNIQNEFLNKNNFIDRSSEIILLSDADIKKYF